MKFSVNSHDLLKKLQIANGVISNNPVLPILEDFLFSIEGNQLTIAATDLETTIVTELDVRAEGGGMVAMPARMLVETLKQLPAQPITFNVDEGSFSVEIISSTGHYRLAGENGRDFPSLPQPDAVDSLNIPTNVLGHAIARTLFATSNDDLRPAMTGVLFEVDFSKITFVATDAHKLVRFRYTNLSSEVSAAFIVPKKALALLSKALPGEGDATMSFNKSNVFFKFGDTQMVCRLIDARYPDYNAVIPVDNPNVLSISRADFQNSLKRISIYANKTTNQIVLNINKDQLTISAQDLDFSSEATENLNCQYEGEALAIGFNAKFLIEMLGVMSTEEIRLELSTPSRAGIMLPSESDEHEDIMMLVMPVMLNN